MDSVFSFIITINDDIEVVAVLADNCDELFAGFL
jgi:hypothetical protein